MVPVQGRVRGVASAGALPQRGRQDLRREAPRVPATLRHPGPDNPGRRHAEPEAACRTVINVLDNACQAMVEELGVGVGLGLPVVDQIMEQHDGGIETKREDGRGTKVCLSLRGSQSVQEYPQVPNTPVIRCLADC